jgi:hypothetical protein
MKYIKVTKFSELKKLNVVRPLKTWLRMKKTKAFCGKVFVSLYQNQDFTYSVGFLDNQAVGTKADLVLEM